MKIDKNYILQHIGGDDEKLLLFLNKHVNVDVNQKEDLTHESLHEFFDSKLCDYFYQYVTVVDSCDSYDDSDYNVIRIGERYFRQCADEYGTWVDWSQVYIKRVKIDYMWGVL